MLEAVQHAERGVSETARIQGVVQGAADERLRPVDGDGLGLVVQDGVQRQPDAPVGRLRELAYRDGRVGRGPGARVGAHAGAVEQAGKSSSIIVTGVDGSPEGVAELKRKGSPFIGTATQNPGAMVEKAVAIASDMLNGKQPAEKTILIPSVLVTRDSVGQYPGW